MGGRVGPGGRVRQGRRGGGAGRVRTKGGVCTRADDQVVDFRGVTVQPLTRRKGVCAPRGKRAGRERGRGARGPPAGGFGSKRKAAAGGGPPGASRAAGLLGGGGELGAARVGGAGLAAGGEEALGVERGH